ncbi:GntR family transcriptional regulator [Streptomyces sp. TE5632]
MKQGTKGFVGVDDAGAGQGGAGRARVPAQPGAEDVDRRRNRPRGAGTGAAAPGGTGVDGVRGEHTHSEPALPLPLPRRPVQRSSVRGQILAALRTALVRGDLRPGAVYSAPVLAERFGVSATPVREAMQQLTLEGAVEVVPNRGFRVVERGDRELAELAEVRALIEIPVVLRLSRTVPAERWAELRPLAEATIRAASSGCRATYAESDRAFHRAVLALAGNEQLLRIAEDLHRRAQWPLIGSAPGAGGGAARLVADAHEHTALLDALIADDPDTVRSLVEEHFTGVV